METKSPPNTPARSVATPSKARSKPSAMDNRSPAIGKPNAKAESSLGQSSHKSKVQLLWTYSPTPQRSFERCQAAGIFRGRPNGDSNPFGQPIPPQRPDDDAEFLHFDKNARTVPDVNEDEVGRRRDKAQFEF